MTTALIASVCLLAQRNEGVRPITLDTDHGAKQTIPDPNAKVTVVIFVTVDCPISNRFAPEIARIADAYKVRAKLFVAYVDPDTSPNAAAAHTKAFGLNTSGLMDPRHQLSAAIGATVTPEAAVLNPKGVILYRGRIDDRFRGHAQSVSKPSSFDLRRALDEVLAGKKVTRPRTAAVGCGIPDLKPGGNSCAIP